MVGLRPDDVFQNSSGYGMFTGGLGFQYGAERLGMLTVPAAAGNSLRQIKFIKDFGTTAIHAVPSYLTRLYEVMQEQGVDPRKDTKLKTFVIPSSVTTIESNAFSYPTSTTVYGVAGSYAESYARWAAFLDISQYRKTGTIGPDGEVQWSYNPSTMSVTVTGPINANDSVYVATYDANGKMLSMEVITSSGRTSQAGSGAKSIALFWLNSDFVPKSDKSVIHVF